MLEVCSLQLSTQSESGDHVDLVSDVSFAVPPAGSLALVGESGSGKTLTLRAILGLLPPGVERTAGQVRFGDGRAEPTAVDPATVRGNGLAMVLQEPMTALNPTMRIGDLIAAAPLARGDVDRRGGRQMAIQLLGEVGIGDAGRRIDAWPHELSGGMRQRVMIAMALATDPTVLLCDEPTTALDVTVQAQVVRLLHRLRIERSLALVFVTHDLALTAQLCDDVCVLRNGRNVEHGVLRYVYADPQHAYTRGLLAAVPDVDHPLARVHDLDTPQAPTGDERPLIDVSDLTVRFPAPTPVVDVIRRRRRWVTAVDGVSLTVKRGHSLAVVGESGSGKSTLARVMCGLTAPTSGRVCVDPSVGRIQMVFQDPSSSLDPRQRVGDAIDEILRKRGRVRRGEVGARRAELLSMVGLDPALAVALPRRLSGGQKQRVAIARALAMEPTVLIADEAVASLDVSIKANVVALLRRLQHELDLTVVFVTHDLAMVRTVCDDIIVLQDGRIVERGKVDTVMSGPQHPYTAALLAAVPRLPSAVAQAPR